MNKFDAQRNTDAVMEGYGKICHASPYARKAMRDTLQDLEKGLPADLANVVSGLLTIVKAADALVRLNSPR